MIKIRGRLVVIEGFRNYPILTLCVNQPIQAGGGEMLVGVYVCPDSVKTLEVRSLSASFLA